MPIELNKEGVSFAKSLIKAGRVVDSEGYYGSGWSFDADNGNALLGPGGDDWATYGKCHLAINTDAEKDTKAYWKYPVAKKDGGEIKLYVAGLHAAASRAMQNGCHEVYNEAHKLAEHVKDEKSADGEDVVRKGFGGVEVKADGLPEHTLRFRISSDRVDRDGDVVLPAGMDLSEYKSNPIFLWGHDFTRPPIGKCVRIAATADGRAIDADFQFAVEESDLAKQVYQLYKGGYLNAVSVGFRIKRASPPDHSILSGRPDLERRCQRVIHEATLLEVSAVGIPSNPEALRKALADGIVVSKSLQATISRSVQEPPVTENPIAAAIGWLKKTLGWGDDTLAKLTVAEIEPLARVEAKGRKKAEPTSTAEDDEVDPDGDGDEDQDGVHGARKPKEKKGKGKPPAESDEKCPGCGMKMAACTCKPEMTKDGDGDGDGDAASGDGDGKSKAKGKAPRSQSDKDRDAEESAEDEDESKGKDPNEQAASGGKPFEKGDTVPEIKSIEVVPLDAVVESVVASVTAQLPALAESIALGARKQYLAHLNRLTGKVS